MNRFLTLYCLPGRLIAEYKYLWPKKGQLWVSDRRRGHGFVHFLYSTGFYLAAFVMLSLVMAAREGQQRARAAETATITLPDSPAVQNGQPLYQGPATFASPPVAEAIPVGSAAGEEGK